MPPNPLLTRRGPSCRDTVATDGDVARAGSLYASLFHDHGFCLYYHHMNPAAREVLHNKYHPVLEQAGASHAGGRALPATAGANPPSILVDHEVRRHFAGAARRPQARCSPPVSHSASCSAVAVEPQAASLTRGLRHSQLLLA